MGQARTQGTGERRASVLRGVLSDLSLPQVAGTALAAVTSMLLSSYIGIAGSIIGVAVASVVSTVCASLYKNFLAASAERIREIPQAVHGSAVAGGPMEPGQGRGGEGAPLPADGVATLGAMSRATADAAPLSGREVTTEAHEGVDDRTAAMAAASTADARAEAPGAEGAETARIQPIRGAGAELGDLASSVCGGGDDAGAAAAFRSEGPAAVAYASGDGGRATATPHLGDADVPADGAVLAARQERLRKARLRRNVVIVAVVSALAAVVVSAGAVWFLTLGQGLGAKPEPVRFSAPAKTQAADDGASSAVGTATDGQQDATAVEDGSAADSSDGATDSGSGQGASDGDKATDGGSGAEGGSGDSSDTGGSGSGGASSGTSGEGAGSSGSGSDASGGTGSTGGSGGSGGSGGGSGASTGSSGGTGSTGASGTGSSGSQGSAGAGGSSGSAS